MPDWDSHQRSNPSAALGVSDRSGNIESNVGHSMLGSEWTYR